MTDRGDLLTGGLAAIFAHPDDESFGCAGALALAHDAGRTTRLLVATRGEAGTPDGSADSSLVDRRERELVCAAQAIGLDEVTVLDGYPDGGLAEMPFDALVDELAAWLADRRPDAILTFGGHGITGHSDHIVIGSAARWAVERLSEQGLAPNAIYVVSPVFDPAGGTYDLSPEEQAASHRIDITGVVERKIAALACHASQAADTTDAIAALRAAAESGRSVYEGYTRVRPAVQSPHPQFDTRLW